MTTISRLLRSDCSRRRSLDLTVGFVGIRDDQLKELRVLRFQVQLETTDCSAYQAGSGVVINQLEVTYRAALRTRTATVMLPYSIEVSVPEKRKKLWTWQRVGSTVRLLAEPVASRKATRQPPVPCI